MTFSPRRWRSVLVLTAALALGTGCTTLKMTGTARSSVEQRLLVRSIERAAAP